MNAHTPGPWTLIGEQGCAVWGGSKIIAQMRESRTNHKQARIDALLIAAAPELLAALQMLSEALPSDAYMRSEGKEPGPGLVMMRAAIAKATGGKA
jgi:hypothetical protein